MIESTLEQKPDEDSNPRMDALQDLLFAVSMAGLLLIPTEFRTFVSVEAAVVVVVGGVVAGVGIALGGVRLNLGDVNTLYPVVGVLTAIATAMVLAWFFLPQAHTATVVQFAVVFILSAALTDVTRHIVSPSFSVGES